jgi:hypothetical protein
MRDKPNLMRVVFVLAAVTIAVGGPQLAHAGGVGSLQRTCNSGGACYCEDITTGAFTSCPADIVPTTTTTCDPTWDFNCNVPFPPSQFPAGHGPRFEQCALAASNCQRTHRIAHYWCGDLRTGGQNL